MPPAFILSQDQTLRFDGYELKNSTEKVIIPSHSITDKQINLFILYGKLRDPIDDRICFYTKLITAVRESLLKLTISNR